MTTHHTDYTEPHLTDLERNALLTTGAGAAGKVLLFTLQPAFAVIGENWAQIVTAVIVTLFALISFAGFDLILWAVVVSERRNGRSLAGVLTILVAGTAAALIALAGARVISGDWLAATPAGTLIAFALYLMWQRMRVVAPAPAPEYPLAAPAQAAEPAVNNNIQLNIAALPPPEPIYILPPTVQAYIAAKAQELSHLNNRELAAELRTSPDTVRRAIADMTQEQP